ncbi:MAG: TIGR01440 family protein [Candidatus Pelethousia sp.]|nr:TIGR01440 family protein [Candidatus Pelethousia sp.]
MQEIYEQARAAAAELMAAADNLKAGDMLVVGCSTSEICGKRIGTGSSEEAAKAVMDAILPEAKARGLFLCAQCCEHLNRCLVVERACMERYDLQQVWVRPHLHAGGAFSMEAMKRLDDYVMVEDLRGKAAAGMDIGGTLIGMHMHPVVVPIHAQTRKIGQANLVMARTRPKYVGGPRALYDDIAQH